MARYRKVDVRMWRDERFRRLTTKGPNGRECWQFLLTNPHTTSIPGVYAAYPETLAAELRWSTEGFLEAFGEAFREGLAKADWKAGLVFIPNAIKYNQPESINVVKSWAPAWDELPECSLKLEAFEHIKAFLYAFREAFGEAFVKACGKPCANQEQEQEQEQEQDSEAPPVPLKCDQRRVQAAWQKHTGLIPMAPLLDVYVSCERIAASEDPPGDPTEYAERAIAEFVKWAASCPPGKQPQLAPHKFVEHLPRIHKRLLRGSGNAIAKLTAANLAARGDE